MPSADPALRRQRMAPPGLGVAAQQRGFVSPGEHQLRPQRGIGAQPLQGLQHQVGVEAAGARVDADRQLALAARHHVLEHGQRRIVDRLVAQVLQLPQHRCLAAAGEAGDQHDPAGARRSCRERSGDLRHAAQRAVERQGDALRRRRGAWIDQRPAADRRLMPCRCRQPRGGVRPAPPTSASRAAATWGRRTMPSPRTSSRPASAGTGRAMPSMMSTRSSATRSKPRASRRSSRSDLPAPGGPISSTPSPVAAGAAPVDLHDRRTLGRYAGGKEAALSPARRKCQRRAP